MEVPIVYAFSWRMRLKVESEAPTGRGKRQVYAQGIAERERAVSIVGEEGEEADNEDWQTMPPCRPGDVEWERSGGLGRVASGRVPRSQAGWAWELTMTGKIRPGARPGKKPCVHVGRVPTAVSCAQSNDRFLFFFSLSLAPLVRGCRFDVRPVWRLASRLSCTRARAAAVSLFRSSYAHEDSPWPKVWWHVGRAKVPFDKPGSSRACVCVCMCGPTARGCDRATRDGCNFCPLLKEDAAGVADGTGNGACSVTTRTEWR